MSMRPTVVIADRSEAFLMCMSIILDRLEFEPLPVASGSSTAKMVRAVRPNILILGGELSDDDPFRLLSELRQDETLSGLPIYFASANETDMERAMAGGANGFLAKPIGLETLHITLEQAHNLPRGQRRSPRAPYQCQVTLTWNGQGIVCQTVLLSEGGVYIRHQSPFPQGCLVDIHLPMPDGADLNLEGEIIYTKSLPDDRFALPPGMAIRFLLPSAETVGHLRRTITELLIGDIVAGQNEPLIRG